MDLKYIQSNFISLIIHMST